MRGLLKSLSLIVLVGSGGTASSSPSIPPCNTMKGPTKSRSLVVVGGSGGVASCTLPLIFREFEFSRTTVIDRKEPSQPLIDRAEFYLENLSPDNFKDVLAKYCQADDILLNLSVVDSSEILIWCMEHDILYLDTSGEEWEDADEDIGLHNRKDFRAASLSNLHMKLKDSLSDLYERHPEKKEWATSVVYHGMNPGLVNQFAKQGLEDIAATLLQRKEGCRNRENIEKYLEEQNYSRLSQALGVKAIHISERDTQTSIKPRYPGEFHSTWSVQGFIAELQMYSEIGLGTHEKSIPREAYVFTDKNHDVSMVMGGKAANIRVMSWVPSGPIQGFPCPHDESITLARFLEVRGEEGELEYRPTVLFVYMPCDASIASIHDFVMNGYEDPDPVLLSDDTIVAGKDEVGILLLGHELGAWWIGSCLDINRARSILPGHNATTMQVAAGVIGALTWMLQNPRVENQPGTSQAATYGYSRKLP